MSGSHRPLPPPAAMALTHPPPPAPPGPHAPPPPGPGLGQPPVHQLPPQSQQGQILGQLPPPPQWQQGSEEAMRAWLAAKAEEDKRRAEEEKTRQESLRLEQRRTEHEILRTSLHGGIPPPMVPVVFAGMGGGNLPQAALDWAQQFMYSQQQPPHQGHQPQLLTAGGPSSPEHRRDSQSQPYGPYPGSGGVPSTPGSAQGPHSGFVAQYPGSPTRQRGYSVPGPGGRGGPGSSHLPSLNTNVPQGPGGPSMPPHQGIASAQQQEPQPSPSIYFHHWQPPTSQAGGSSSNQPATPSVGESPRKRKATGPQPGPPPPSSRQRSRSPPFGHGTGSALSNPPPGRRRGHSRQRSDVSSYRYSGRGRSEGSGLMHRAMSPAFGSAPGSAREGDEALTRPPAQASRSGAHSVSSLLSEDPSPQPVAYASGPSDIRHVQDESEPRESRQSPHHGSGDATRGGAAGSAGAHEGDDG